MGGGETRLFERRLDTQPMLQFCAANSTTGRVFGGQIWLTITNDIAKCNDLRVTYRSQMFLVAGPLESRQYADKHLDRHPYHAWINRYRLDQNQHPAHRDKHDLQMLGPVI